MPFGLTMCRLKHLTPICIKITNCRHNQQRYDTKKAATILGKEAYDLYNTI